MEEDELLNKAIEDMITYVKRSELETGGEYKEKLIDLLLILGGSLHFYDSYFPWNNNTELITGLYLETPDSTEISCWTIKNKTRPGKTRREVIKGKGWITEITNIFFKNLYEHSINENKKIYELGAWCV